MDEAFLHYIWKFQFFDKTDLKTIGGDAINIIRPGILNNHAGADFSNAKIVFDDIEWNGYVEIHLDGNDWYHHGHHQNPDYDNVILHVVWSANGKTTKRSDLTEIPVLELKTRIFLSHYEKYRRLSNSKERILCRKFLKDIDRLKIFEAFDKALVKRLERKANEILVRLRKNDRDWEETCFQILAGNFGFKINKEPFLSLARSIPYKILLKHSDNLIQIEALLFGMAGFLNVNESDPYFNVLKKEFQFLQSKYQLSGFVFLQNWKFLRMRPANFPTIRIAQLAKLISIYQKLFSMIINTREVTELLTNFKVAQSEYWRNHYDFSKKSNRQMGGLGKKSIENIMINTVVPLLAAYSIEKDDVHYLERAQVILQNLKPEVNNITREWQEANVKITSAFDSQASIELINEYCSQKKCLDCSIGMEILQS